MAGVNSGAVTFQNIVKFCAQRNDTGFKKRDDVINDVTGKLVNATHDLRTVENSPRTSVKVEEQNENKTRDKVNQKQGSKVMTTRDGEGRHQTSSRNTSPEALMDRICPVLTRLDDPDNGSGGDEMEEIVNEILLTLFWDLHSLMHKNHATADGEAYINGKHYDLNELMASCCSFG